MNRRNIKLFFIIIALGIIIFINPVKSNAQEAVTDETTLNNAINSADSGSTITLQNNITITKPIVIQKELTINGNGYTLSGDSNWTSTSGNQTMLTAQFADGKLTLKNIKLQNGPKYGVQSYDGAYVILDDVFISGFNYGGVLVNGGRLEVRELNLGYNGADKNNGIEIDKGASATNNPELIMNGTLTSTEKENVVYVAENGHLTSFTITNTDDTKNKVFVTDESVLLTDSANNILSESTLPSKVAPNVADKKVIITLYAEDKVINIAVTEGEKITKDMLKSHIDLKKGYIVKDYYLDKDYKEKFDFETKINENTSIYAKIEKEETIKDDNKENIEENKDKTPVTGNDNYILIATFAIMLSSVLIIALYKNKSKLKVRAQVLTFLDFNPNLIISFR